MKTHKTYIIFGVLLSFIFSIVGNRLVIADLPIEKPEGYFDLQDLIEVEGRKVHIILSEEQFLALNDDHKSDIIILKNNLDFQGQTLQLFDTFEGVFNGMGNQLQNFSVSNESFLAHTNRGVIENIRFTNVSVQTTQSDNFGVLITENDGLVQKVSFDSLTYSSSPISSPTSYYLGIIAAINHSPGIIKDVSVNVEFQSSNVLRARFGGISGANHGSIERALSTGNINANGANITHMGGIVSDNFGTISCFQ